MIMTYYRVAASSWTVFTEAIAGQGLICSLNEEKSIVTNRKLSMLYLIYDNLNIFDFRMNLCLFIRSSAL